MHNSNVMATFSKAGGMHSQWTSTLIFAEKNLKIAYEN